MTTEKSWVMMKAFELQRCQTSVKIPYTDHVTSEVVCKSVNQESALLGRPIVPHLLFIGQGIPSPQNFKARTGMIARKLELEFLTI